MFTLNSTQNFLILSSLGCCIINK